MTTTYRSTKDIAATIRKQLKQELPSCKFSVTVHSYSGGSSITVALMSSPFVVVRGYHEFIFGTGGEERPYTKVKPFPGYAQLNHHQLLQPHNSKRLTNGEYLTEDGWELLSKAAEIMSREHWDESESQIDYHFCNFYRHLRIGKWNKEYQVKK